MSKTIQVRAVWESYHDLEVPDDFKDTGSLDDFGDALEEVTSDVASLVDWCVS